LVPEKTAAVAAARENWAVSMRITPGQNWCGAAVGSPIYSCCASSVSDQDIEMLPTDSPFIVVTVNFSYLT
jgi:hypothetical protein